MHRKAAISESFLAQVWQQQLAGREPLVTTGGDTVEVLHPGWPTHDCGPDFRDALIASKTANISTRTIAFSSFAIVISPQTIRENWRGLQQALGPNEV